MINLLDLQKKFRLFQLGDVVEGTVISVEETVRVKTSGGVLGVLEKNEMLGELLPGNKIEAVVKAFVDENIPVFEPTLNFLITRKPQQAVVKFASPRAVVVAFDINPDWIGCYEPQTMPEELSGLIPDDRVIASEITPGEDYFKIGQLQKSLKISVPAPKKPSVVFEDWDDEKIKEISAQGSSKIWRKIRLGKVYIGEIYTRSEVILPGEVHGFLNSGLFPDDALRFSVRVIFINKEDKRITVEFLKSESQTETAPTAGKSVKSLLNEERKTDGGVLLNHRDDSVYHIGKRMGSLNKIKGCWLGFTYRVNVTDGRPNLSFCEKRQKNEREEDRYNLKINVIVDSAVAKYQEGDIVFIQVKMLKFINGTDVLPDRECEIHVDVIKVENGKAPVDLNKITLNDENLEKFKSVI